MDAENITACLTADDGNPYTRLPLILARMRGIPALACHHGALDYAMAIKTNYADFYLAKTEMERDYLLNVCRLAPESVVLLDSNPEKSRPEMDGRRDRGWMVFFTENSLPPWRGEEVYRELMPELASLSRSLGLKLVFKLHPFENKKNYQRWIKRFLPGSAQNGVSVITGPPSAELWRSVRFALTVQSTTALECHSRGIPVFLCRWLREPNCAYLDQYARFGVGHVLESPAQIAEIPRLLKNWRPADTGARPNSRETSAVTLHQLLGRALASPGVAKAQCTGD